MIDFLKNNKFIFLLLIISLFSVLPFFSPGFFTFHDDTQVPRVHEMAKSLSDGMFPVRWVEDLGYGFGYPIFNFYSVLPYYIGGGLVLLGFSALTATKTVFTLAILASGIGMFILVRNFFGNPSALAASVIYTYFPYHAVNTYVRGDLAEVFSYALLPLVFLGLFKIHYLVEKNFSPQNYLILASVSVAAVVISHNLSFFMLFIFMSVFILLSLVFGRKKVPLVISYLLVLAIAFLLSAFYSIPAVFEIMHTNVQSVIGGGSDWRDHFVCLPQLWDSLWGFGGSAPGCLDGMSFKLGKLNIILGILAFIVFVISFRKNKEKFFIPFVSLILLVISVFMTVEYSRFIWNLPLMSYLQFPWRFINFTGLFLSLSIGYLVWFVSTRTDRRITLIISGLIIIVTLFYNQRLFNPQSFNDHPNSFYTNSEHIRWTVSKISDEYLYRNFKKPSSVRELREDIFEIVEGEGDIKIIENKTQVNRADLIISEPSRIRVNIAFFPAWTIKVNEKKVSYIVGNDGLYLSMPPGRHKLEALFEETLVERLANTLTVIGVIALITVIIGKLRVPYGKKTS